MVNKENQSIIITGAASGIGLHLATTLEKLGNQLLLIDLNRKKLYENFQESSSIALLTGSVADEDLWNQVLKLVQDKKLKISHLINSAGVIKPGFLEKFIISDIDYHLDVNVKGSILGTTLIGREMGKQGFGHIINISSLAGLAPVPGLSLYSASKFAIRGFSLSVAPELKKAGVDLSVICPDLVQTPMLNLQLNYPEEAVLTFSGPKKVLQVEDIVQVILKLMVKPKQQVCVPEHRGFLSKIAGGWPGLAELFRKSLEKRGKKAVERLR